ncbi:MAG: hypothetical protein RIS54_1908 [Verrucomicrobiota bacterium]
MAADMRAGIHHLAEATPIFSTPVFATFWFVVIGCASAIGVVLWRKLRDVTYLRYAGYVGAIGVMSFIDHVAGDWLHERLGDAFIYVNNFLHLPYAVFYLLFVNSYFNVAETGGGWARLHKGLLVAYGFVLLWLGADAVAGTFGSEWGILSVNLVNLVSSLVLAGIATHDNRPGAREFLYASLPLTVSGLVLVAQFLSESTHVGGPALLAFRTGFIMHVMIFLIALSVRYREKRLRLS